MKFQQSYNKSTQKYLIDIAKNWNKTGNYLKKECKERKVLKSPKTSPKWLARLLGLDPFFIE